MKNLISSLLVTAALITIIAAICIRPRFGHPVTESMREQAVAATSSIVSPLPDVIDRRPLVVFFILPGCPCSESYEPYTQQLCRAFSPRVQFLGVVEGSDQQLQSWRQRHETPFDLVTDPDGALAQRFKAERSAYTAVIIEGDTISQLWPGFSKTMLEELCERLRHEVGDRPTIIEFANAPSDLTSGCLIDRPWSPDRSFRSLRSRQL